MNIKGLKKYFTGAYLPVLDIEVHPSIFGIHELTKSNLAEIIYEIITVVIGNKKHNIDKYLIFILFILSLNLF